MKIIGDGSEQWLEVFGTVTGRDYAAAIRLMRDERGVKALAVYGTFPDWDHLPPEVKALVHETWPNERYWLPITMPAHNCGAP